MPGSKLTVPKTYPDLRRRVQEVLIGGQQRIEKAKVRTYWETGRIINEHVLAHKHRANYGAQVFADLERDLKISTRVLYSCAQFARVFPNLNGRSILSWAHYRILCQVETESDRKSLIAETLKHGWTSDQLDERIRRLNAVAWSGAETEGQTAPATPPRLLIAKRGTPGAHRVVARGERLAVDLGFKLYVALDEEAAFKAGGFATFDARGRPQAATAANKADLFTYAATVRRVVDGDTLEVDLPLPRGFTHQLKLRLRALDCPELDTPAGKAAKRFTESLIAPAAAIEIVTSKPDKYDRYLADVFIPDGAGGFTFLNNELLGSGHAVRKDDWSAADWER